MLQNYGNNTNTRSEYLTLISFPCQQRLRERAFELRNMHNACMAWTEEEGGRCTTTLILNPGIRRRWVINFIPQSFSPGKEPRYTLAAGWASEQVWTFRRREISCLYRDSNPGSFALQPSHYTDHSIPCYVPVPWFYRVMNTVPPIAGTRTEPEGLLPHVTRRLRACK